MRVIHWLVSSRLWVAMAAMAWSIETFVRMGAWVRWTLVSQVFFLTWIAYLFLADNAIRNKRACVLVALTGACVTFQSIDTLKIPIFCGIIVLFYRTHWLPDSWKLSGFSLRSLPLINNVFISICWVMICMVWPIQQSGGIITAQFPFIAAAFLWICALSMMEDLFEESEPDATLRFLGRKGIRVVALVMMLCAVAINCYFAEQQLSVWVSMIASIGLIGLLKGSNRTPLKSWLIDAMIVLRFPF